MSDDTFIRKISGPKRVAVTAGCSRSSPLITVKVMKPVMRWAGQITLMTI